MTNSVLTVSSLSCIPIERYVMIDKFDINWKKCVEWENIHDKMKWKVKSYLTRIKNIYLALCLKKDKKGRLKKKRNKRGRENMAGLITWSHLIQAQWGTEKRRQIK